MSPTGRPAVLPSAGRPKGSDREVPQDHYPIHWLQQPMSVKNNGTNIEDLPSTLLGMPALTPCLWTSWTASIWLLSIRQCCYTCTSRYQSIN